MNHKKISIKSYFRRICATAIAVVLAVQGFSVTALFLYNQHLNNQYITGTVKKMADSLEKYFNQVEKIGFGISSNWSFISLYSDSKYIYAGNSFENAFQTATYVCSLNPSILDILVIDLHGSTRSFFSGYNYDILSDLKTQGIVTDAFNLDRKFYFFPEESAWSRDYFLYYFPIFSVEVTPYNANKVATAVLICNKQELHASLEYDSAEIPAVFSLYEGNSLLYSSYPETEANIYLNKEQSLFKQELSYPALSIEGAATGGVKIQDTIQWIILYVGAVILTFIVFLLIINRIIQRCVTAPIQAMTMQLSNFNSGDLNKRIDFTNVAEIDDIVANTNHMIDSIKTITKNIFTTQDHLYETELRQKEAELYALQSQINPHFLYNTLQCIRGLATQNRMEDIKEISLAMSDVFRYSIQPGAYVKCIEEIKIIYKYLSIYKIRFNNRISYDIDVEDEILECVTPKMIIQPTVENAMVHAFKEVVQQPRINIIGRMEEDCILFKVIDNGTGISDTDLKRIRILLSRSFNESISQKSEYGLGLYNINRRIKLTYGDQFGISMFSNLNGTEVDIRIPVVKEEGIEQMLPTI